MIRALLISMVGSMVVCTFIFIALNYYDKLLEEEKQKRAKNRLKEMKGGSMNE